MERNSVAQIPQGSETFRRLNPHVFGPQTNPGAVVAAMEQSIATPVKRIRQREEETPLLNKLETAFLAELTFTLPGVKVHAQSWRVKIARSSWFKVDFCACVDGQWVAWEVKGNKGKNIDRGKLALKVAASAYPEVKWFLVWRIDGQWQRQEILP